MENEVVISKAVLRELGKVKGSYDVDTGMVFTGFIGRVNLADMLYYGKLYFETATEEPAESVSITQIIEGSYDGHP